ncbi:hypothetical protein E4T50_06188 [Aureobasidium sp. EXF-12298]|nr:hypothetical protein E4T50_06188 [Aureobasidium sp. EXF-12298]KAI4759432.1 hypothetical protein E4T51_07540 [Aureobasidium sp. EXF-12344]KAI4777467.1 hypothetical protein E4T52_07598 [Aureobasidium sp. EXF-3400]
MFFKISIVFAIFALLIQVAVSNPPACVLQAVNQAGKSPTDVKDICAGGSTVEQSLVSDCGNNFDAAMSAFSSICSGVGVTISTWDAASSSATAVSTPVSSNAVSTSSTSTTVAASDVKSDSTSTVASSQASIPSSVLSTESPTESTNSGVTTATGILTATDTVTSTQPASSSGVSTPSGPVSTGAAEHVEKNGWVLGAMAAAGLVIAL